MRLDAKSLDIQPLAVKLPQTSARKKESEIDDDDRNRSKSSKRSKAILSKARERRQRALNEFESKKLLAAYGIPVSQRILCFLC